MDKVRQRIDDIYKEKEGLQKEFEELQNNCPHDLYKIGLFSWHVGNISTGSVFIVTNILDMLLTLKMQSSQKNKLMEWAKPYIPAQKKNKL
jgi:hypothetical protein